MGGSKQKSKFSRPDPFPKFSRLWPLSPKFLFKLDVEDKLASILPAKDEE
jgi:hypothetical protein